MESIIKLQHYRPHIGPRYHNSEVFRADVNHEFCVQAIRSRKLFRYRHEYLQSNQTFNNVASIKPFYVETRNLLEKTISKCHQFLI